MKFLSSDGLKVVLSKIKDMFYTKTEVDEKLKSVSGGGTEEKITVKPRYSSCLFNFYKKGNVVEVYQTFNSERYIDYVSDNFLPKNYMENKEVIIGNMLNFENRNVILILKEYKQLIIRGGDFYYSDSDKTYGETFIGKYFTN